MHGRTAMLLLMATALLLGQLGPALAGHPDQPLASQGTGPGCNTTTTTTSACSEEAKAPQQQAAGGGGSSGLQDLHMPTSAYITVAVVGSVLLSMMALGAALHYHKRRRLLAMHQLAEQRRQEEEAAEEKKANTYHEIVIPPLILNPDSSVHLGSMHSGLSQGSEGGGSAAAAGGQRVMVRPNESVFTRVTLWQTSMSAEILAAHLEAQQAQLAEAAEAGAAPVGAAAGAVPDAGAGRQP